MKNDENSIVIENNRQEGAGDKHLVVSAVTSLTSYRDSEDQSPSAISSPVGRDVLINTEVVSLKRVLSDSEEDLDDEEEQEEEEEDQANGEDDEDQSDDGEEVIKTKPKKKKKRYSYSVRDRQMQRFPVKVSWLCLIYLKYLQVFE